MGALCFGLPTLVSLAIVYLKIPSLRRPMNVLTGIGGCLIAIVIGLVVFRDMKNGPVVSAVDAKDLISLRYALDAGGSAKADIGMDYRLPVLFRAIDQGDAASVELLLQRGADPNERGNDGMQDRSPFEAALGNPKIQRILRRYGAR